MEANASRVLGECFSPAPFELVLAGKQRSIYSNN